MNSKALLQLCSVNIPGNGILSICGVFFCCGGQRILNGFYDSKRSIGVLLVVSSWPKFVHDFSLLFSNIDFCLRTLISV